MPQFGSGNNSVWLALAIFFAFITFVSLMVWGIMRARSGTRIEFTPLYLRGLVLGVLFPLLYAASDNNDWVGYIGLILFLLGIPMLLVWFASREIKKIKSPGNKKNDA